MNSLSWMFYAADAFNSLSIVLGAGAFVAAIALFGVTMVYNIEKDAWPPHFGKAVFGIFFAVVLAALSPSKQTIYLIIGSEIGDRVVTSQDGQELLNLLKDRVKDALKK